MTFKEPGPCIADCTHYETHFWQKRSRTVFIVCQYNDLSSCSRLTAARHHLVALPSIQRH